MKFKTILLSLGLTLGLGIGVSVGLNASRQVEESKAATNSVTIAGSFNGWNTTADPCTKDNGYWVIQKDLSAGDTFKFVVNGGTWVGWGNGISYPSGKFAQAASDGNIECKTAGAYLLKAIDGIDGYGDKSYGLVIENYVAPTAQVDVTLQATFDRDVPTYVDIYARGAFNEWTSSVSCKMTRVNARTFTLALSDIEVGNYGYKLVTEYTGAGSVSWDNQIDTSDQYVTIIESDDGNTVVLGSTRVYDFTTNMPQPVADGAYLRGDWTNGWTVNGQLPMTTVSADQQYTISNVPLSGGCAVKMVVMANYRESYWGEFNSVSSTDPISYPVQEVEDNEHHVNAGVVSTGTYNITVTKNQNGSWDYVFEGTANEDLDAACTFARNFVSSMNSNCPYNYSTSSYNAGKSASTVASAWSSQISTFNGLTSNVRSYLTNESSNVTDITNFFATYEYVYKKYSEVRAIQGANFLGRTINLSNAINPSLMNNDSVSIAVTTTSILAITAVSLFFFLKKKKESI